MNFTPDEVETILSRPGYGIDNPGKPLPATHSKGKVKSLGQNSTKILEKDFQQTVIDYAHLKGWKVAAFRKALTKDGNWITPVQGDGKGWPDLFFVNAELNRFFWAELKSDNGKVSPEQQEWLGILAFCGAEVYVWNPSHWKQIEEALESA